MNFSLFSLQHKKNTCKIKRILYHSYIFHLEEVETVRKLLKKLKKIIFLQFDGIEVVKEDLTFMAIDMDEKMIKSTQMDT